MHSVLLTPRGPGLVLAGALVACTSATDARTGPADPPDLQESGEGGAEEADGGSTVDGGTGDGGSGDGGSGDGGSGDGGSGDGGTTEDCSDTLATGPAVAGPQGLMIQAHTVGDLCALEQAMDHVCNAHQGSGTGALHDLLLTDVVTVGSDGRPSETLNEDVLDLVVERWDCWDNVFFGTIPETLLDDPYDSATIESASLRWTWLTAHQRVGASLSAWLAAHASGRTWHGYVSYEAHLEAMTDSSYRAAYEALLLQATSDLDDLSPGMTIAWSPTFWGDPDDYSSASLSAVGAAVGDLLEGVPGIDWVLIQDHLGVDTSLTCDDALAWLALVDDAAPHLSSLQLNVEYFTIDGGGIGAGDATELAARIACYQAAGASLGASFEYRYWYEVHGH